MRYTAKEHIMKKTTISILFVGIFLASCATAPNITYIEPIQKDYSKNLEFNKSSEDVWSALVDYAAESFFAINTYEKDSGLMTLSFTSTPERYVDCGNWIVNGASNNYVQFMRMRPGTSVNLNGIMNIRVVQRDAERTSLTVNARYILTVSVSGTVYNPVYGVSTPSSWTDTYTFDSKTTETVYISNPSVGTQPTRTCGPTGEAETTILRGVSNLLGD